MHAPPRNDLNGQSYSTGISDCSDELALRWGMGVDLSAPVMTGTFALLGFLQLLGLSDGEP